MNHNYASRHEFCKYATKSIMALMLLDCIADIPKLSFSCQTEFYQRMKMIDYGSFGDIFVVRSKSDKKTYAIKQIKYRGNLQNNSYIINEMVCLSKFDHRNIIKMHEILVNDHIVNIVMDYAENESLERYVADVESVDEKILHDIYSQILLGVQYCHHMDIAHKDLNPSNILLTKDLVVKIADFGIAVNCSDEDDNPILCTDYLGNVAYLPPEVLMETPFYPKPVDIWSLGILLLYLFYQDIPYKGFQDEVIDKELKERWTVFIQGKNVKGCERIVSVVEQCLAINPKLRTNISDLTRRWDKVSFTIRDES